MPEFPETVMTGRLVLSRIRADELPVYLAFYQDEKVTATLGGVRSEERVRKWLDWQLQHWREHAFGWWTMRDRTTGAFVGRGGIQRAEVDGKDEVELGYGLLPGYWGLGLAAEMSREALRLGFDVLGLKSVVSFTLPTNHPSRRVMEKVGMSCERDIIWADLPHVLYRIDRATACQSMRSADASRSDTPPPPRSA